MRHIVEENNNKAKFQEVECEKNMDCLASDYTVNPHDIPIAGTGGSEHQRLD